MLGVVKQSMGYQGRLGNLFWRSQKMRKILEVGVIKAQGWQRS